MRRIKYLLFLLILLCSFYNVFAKEDSITISSIILNNKQEDVEEKDSPVIDHSQIQYDLVFHDTGEAITYDIKIKNNTDTHYIINQVFDNNSNKAIKHEYIIPDNDFNKGDKQTIQMKVIYDEEIPSDSVLENSIYHLDDNVTISIDLIEYNLFYILNPRTSPNAIFFYIIFIVLIAFGITMVKKKKTALSIVVLLIAITTYNVMAKDRETVDISLNSKVEIPINFISYNWRDIVSNNYSNNYTKVVVSKDVDIPSNAIDVSENRDGSIKVWLDNDTLYLGSKYRMYIPSNGSSFFNRNRNIISLDFKKDSISSKFTENFSDMFYYLTQLEELNTSWINTDNATDIRYMFQSCSKIKELDLSGFYNPNVSDLYYNLISGCSSLEELDLSNWKNSSSITSIKFQYFPSTLKKLNVDNFDTSHLTTAYYMFSYSPCSNVVLDLSTWDLSGITSMSYMFYSSKFNEIKMPGGEFSNLTDVKYMFYQSTIENIEFEENTCPVLVDSQYMFYCSTYIGSVNIGNFDFSHVIIMYDLFYNGTYGEIIFDGIDTSSVENMSCVFGNVKGIEKLDLSDWNFDRVQNMYGFLYYSEIREIKFGEANTPNLKIVDNMFLNTKYLEKIDWGTFDTSSVTSAYSMFSGSGIAQLDLSTLDFSNLTSFNDFISDTVNLVEVITPKNMFDKADFFIYLPSIFIDSNNNRYEFIDSNTPSRTKITIDDSQAILLSGKSLNIKLKRLSGSTNVYYSTSNTNIIRFEHSNTAPDLSQMTSDNLISVTSTNPIYAWFDNGTIKYYSEQTIYANPDSSYMFYYMYKLESADFSGINTSMMYNAYYMFGYAGYNVTNLSLDLSNFDVSHIKNMTGMFYDTGCNSTTFQIQGLSNWNTSNVISMSYLFSSAGQYATTWSIDLSSWDVSHVTNMSYMFSYAGYSATTWSVGDLSGWNTSNVTSMYSMFNAAAYSAESFNIGNLSNWDVSNVTNMSYLFNYSGLEATTWYVGDLSNWDVSSVTVMQWMFNRSAFSATSFDIGDLSNWDTSNVTKMDFMFSETGKIATTWNNIGSFKIYTASVEGMFSETPPAKARLIFYNNPTSFIRARDNIGIFTDGVTTEDSLIIVDYTSEVTSIDDIIATQPVGGHVVKGNLIS